MSKIKDEKSPQMIIDEKTKKFIEENKRLLKECTKVRKHNLEQALFIYKSHKDIYNYLTGTKIMIITANQIERDTLFAYAVERSSPYIVKIAKKNLVYSFFKIGDNQVVHVENVEIGSYTHGGSAATIVEAMEEANPCVIISLGVAFGADYEKHKIGDVLIGKQFFSYDKGAKISGDQLDIKRLHVHETDNYMLSRLKSNISMEEEYNGELLDNKFQVILGNMVTGEYVIDSLQSRSTIFSPFKPFGIIGGEMEAYGLFEKIDKNTHCILMKGICDWAVGKNKGVQIASGETYNYKNDFQTLAMFNVCAVCEKLLISSEMYADLKERKYTLKRLRKFFRWLQYPICE